MTESWTDAEDRLLARSIFGTDDWETARGMVLDWTAGRGFGPAAVSAIELSVGAVATVALADGSRIVVKAWPGSADPRALAAQMEVQAAMGARGFPAPAVLTSVSALGPCWAVGMAYDRAGVPTDARLPGVRRTMAAGLARFVAEADAHRGVDGLPRRSLPPEGALWPKPHNALFDFEATVRGAGRIDEVARPALRAMRRPGAAPSSATATGAPRTCGWARAGSRCSTTGTRCSSTARRSSSGTPPPTSGSPRSWTCRRCPRSGEVAAFVREYEAARGTPFTPSELAEVEAGATYLRAYAARCEHAIDPEGARWRGSWRERLERDGPFRFDRA